ncbi:MAG: hypothetical protein WCC92_06340 [Candidatus Korobacteraceae bacterium]
MAVATEDLRVQHLNFSTRLQGRPLKVIFPAAVPVEIYIPERKAEFLLSNAVDARDYQAAVEEVRKLGIDPGDIPHYKKVRRAKQP